MKTYLISIAAVVLACGSVQYLAGDLKLKKQIFFIASLCVVFSLFAPIVAWLPQAVETMIPTFSETTPSIPDAEYHLLLKEGERAVSDAICKQVKDKMGLNENDISISISLSYTEIDNIYIKKIDVNLARATDGYLAKDITNYLKELFACNVLVHVGGA